MAFTQEPNSPPEKQIKHNITTTHGGGDGGEYTRSPTKNLADPLALLFVECDSQISDDKRGTKIERGSHLKKLKI